MTILPLLAAALLARADDSGVAYIRMPKLVFAIARAGDKTVLRCAPGQASPVCEDFNNTPIELEESVWSGLAGSAVRVLRRRDETSEGASFLFEPLAAKSRGPWTIELFDARSAQPGLQPLSGVWPDGAARPDALERLKYGVVTDIVGYEKKEGRVARVFTSALAFQRASKGPFDPAKLFISAATRGR
jgi:hypothetical protein